MNDRQEAREERGEGRGLLAIVGGGLAGLAAAVAGVEKGYRVELFDQFHSLGGRAGSFVDSTTGDRIDFCQHLAMGCCTCFLDFCRRTGIDDCFERCVQLHFIAPDGRQCDVAPSSWLPAPLHRLPGLMKLKYLSFGERCKIITALRQLKNSRELSGLLEINSIVQHANCPHPLPLSQRERGVVAGQPITAPGDPGSNISTIGDWLRSQNQSQRAIDQFWSVVLVSALSETIDQASFNAARKVFLDGFLGARDASDLVIPMKPLGEILNDRIGRWLADHGVSVHFGTAVRRIESENDRVSDIVLADGTRRQFDYVVSAVPWRNVKSLFDQELLDEMPALCEVERIEPAAITAIHLWFDRPVMPLPHAVLIGRLGQWVFANGPRLQVVVSASHRLPKREHAEWVSAIRGELETVWPEIGQTRLIHNRVISQPMAVFSMQPGMERFRADQKTGVGNLALAGDWTATGWPGTMESAVRSGFQAVKALQ